MVLAKGLRGRSRYCWAGTDKVDSRAVSALEGRVLTAFVVSFASAMRQLEYKSGVSPLMPGKVNGVYYADYASLVRFFESGKLLPHMPESKGTPDFSESDEPVELWSGTRPAVSDLERMLEVDPHFQRLANKWKPELVTVGIAKNHDFCSTVLGRINCVSRVGSSI